MLERYSHIRMEAKRRALEALSGQKGKSNGIDNSIKAGAEVTAPLFLAEKMVGARGFEPRTPTVSRCDGRIPISSALPFVNKIMLARLEK